MARKKNGKNPYDLTRILDESAQIKALIKLQPLRDQQTMFDAFAKEQAKTAKSTVRLMSGIIAGSAQAEIMYPADKREEDRKLVETLASKAILSPQEEEEKKRAESRLSDYDNAFSTDYNARLLHVISKQRRAALDAICS